MTKRCCCGAFSVTTGAQILAALMILGAVGSFISACVPDAKHTAGTRVGTALSSVVELIAGVLVFMAISKKRSALMFPMLAYAAISLFVIAIACILCVYGLFDQHSVVPNWIRDLLEKEDALNTTVSSVIETTELITTTTEAPISPEQYVFILTVLFTLIAFISLAFSIWYFSVFNNCYKHLKEQESTRAYNQYAA